MGPAPSCGSELLSAQESEAATHCGPSVLAHVLGWAGRHLVLWVGLLRLGRLPRSAGGMAGDGGRQGDASGSQVAILAGMRQWLGCGLSYPAIWLGLTVWVRLGLAARLGQLGEVRRAQRPELLVEVLDVGSQRCQNNASLAAGC